MGFLSRLFGRGQEEPAGPPATEPAPEPEPEPAPEPEPEPEPLPVEAESAPPAPEPEPEPVLEPEAELELEPEPEVTGPPSELALTLDEAIAALRAAGSDGIRIGFLSREYLRAGEEERPGARRRLVSVLDEQLRARSLLAEGGRFELREEPTLADANSR